MRDLGKNEFGKRNEKEKGIENKKLKKFNKNTSFLQILIVQKHFRSKCLM